MEHLWRRSAASQQVAGRLRRRLRLEDAPGSFQILEQCAVCKAKGERTAVQQPLPAAGARSDGSGSSGDVGRRGHVQPPGGLRAGKADERTCPHFPMPPAARSEAGSGLGLFQSLRDAGESPHLNLDRSRPRPAHTDAFLWFTLRFGSLLAVHAGAAPQGAGQLLPQSLARRESMGPLPASRPLGATGLRLPCRRGPFRILEQVCAVLFLRARKATSLSLALRIFAP